MSNTQVTRRSVSMSPEIDEYVRQLEQRKNSSGNGEGCRFKFSHFVCDLILEYRARELREQKSDGTG